MQTISALQTPTICVGNRVRLREGAVPVVLVRKGGVYQPSEAALANYLVQSLRTVSGLVVIAVCQNDDHSSICALQVGGCPNLQTLGLRVDEFEVVPQ